MRTKLRQLLMGLATVTGIRPSGFFIPYRYAHQLRRPPGSAAYEAVEAVFEKAEPSFRRVLAAFEDYADDLLAIGNEAPPEPRWNQDWFPGLDAAALYTMVRSGKPRRVVEVGSGHSTRFMARAIRDGGLEARITAIDPQPRAALSGLDVDFMPSTLQDTGTQIFDDLRHGDMAFFDSSHILMPGTDVDVLLNTVLPNLCSGVIVHIHDIFLPDGYPETWQWRGYNEQLGIAPLIIAGGFEVLFASHYVRSRMKDDVEKGVGAKIDRPHGCFETSLWLRKTGSNV